MGQYFFVLGRDPALSLAEIIQSLSQLVISYSIKYFSPEAVILETDKDLNAVDQMSILGGTVKIGKVIDKVGLEEEELKFANIFSAENISANYLPKREGKMHIGISIYNAGGNDLYVSKLFDNLKDLNVSIKDNLREKGIRAGFIQIKDRFLTSVSVAKNELLNKGAEIVLLVTKDKILVGKTLNVQEFQTFSFRDMGRPMKDKRAGIMPPKLARMMINLAGIKKDQVLLDPFCGSGTILQEAVVAGYKNIRGSDISQRAISDTRSNLDWLFQNFRQLGRLSYNITIEELDVRCIAQKIRHDSIDTVVTEPYLGPPLFRKPNFSEITKIFSEISRLYITAFEQFSKILPTGGKVVIIFPVFEENGKPHLLEILPQIQALGFENIILIPNELQLVLPRYLTRRKTIIYGGSQQFLKREILLFRKI